VGYPKALDAKYAQVAEKSQDIIDVGTIIHDVEYRGIRGYLMQIVKQINRSYEENIFDWCAVLMRRSWILLILSYRNLGIDDAIKYTAGNHHMLEAMITDAKANTTLSLSRNSKESLELFRMIGDFSAHKIEYACRREYIQPHIMEYRALFVELLHNHGIGK
jgi:hypothetical protein